MSVSESLSSSFLICIPSIYLLLSYTDLLRLVRSLPFQVFHRLYKCKDLLAVFIPGLMSGADLAWQGKPALLL